MQEKSQGPPVLLAFLLAIAVLFVAWAAGITIPSSFATTSPSSVTTPNVAHVTMASTYGSIATGTTGAEAIVSSHDAGAAAIASSATGRANAFANASPIVVRASLSDSIVRPGNPVDGTAIGFDAATIDNSNYNLVTAVTQVTGMVHPDATASVRTQTSSTDLASRAKPWAPEIAIAMIGFVALAIASRKFLVGIFTSTRSAPGYRLGQVPSLDNRYRDRLSGRLSVVEASKGLALLASASLVFLMVAPSTPAAASDGSLLGSSVDWTLVAIGGVFALTFAGLAAAKVARR